MTSPVDRSGGRGERYAGPMGDPSASTRDQLWRLLFFAAAGLLLVGLAFDGWSPGTGTSGDVAHSVVVVGGTVLVLAAVMLAVSPILFRRSAERGGWRVVQVAVPVLVVGVVGPAMVAAASSSTRSEPTAALPGAVAALAGTGAAHGDTRTSTPTRRAHPPPRASRRRRRPRRGRRSAPRSRATPPPRPEPSPTTGTERPFRNSRSIPPPETLSGSSWSRPATSR